MSHHIWNTHCRKDLVWEQYILRHKCCPGVQLSKDHVQRVSFHMLFVTHPWSQLTEGGSVFVAASWWSHESLEQCCLHIGKNKTQVVRRARKRKLPLIKTSPYHSSLSCSIMNDFNDHGRVLFSWYQAIYKDASFIKQAYEDSSPLTLPAIPLLPVNPTRRHACSVNSFIISRTSLVKIVLWRMCTSSCSGSFVLLNIWFETKVQTWIYDFITVYMQGGKASLLNSEILAINHSNTYCSSCNIKSLTWTWFPYLKYCDKAPWSSWTPYSIVNAVTWALESSPPPCVNIPEILLANIKSALYKHERKNIAWFLWNYLRYFTTQASTALLLPANTVRGLDWGHTKKSSHTKQLSRHQGRLLMLIQRIVFWLGKNCCREDELD